MCDSCTDGHSTGMFNAELVLTGILRQQLDYTVYPLCLDNYAVHYSGRDYM